MATLIIFVLTVLLTTVAAGALFTSSLGFRDAPDDEGPAQETIESGGLHIAYVVARLQGPDADHIGSLEIYVEQLPGTETPVEGLVVLVATDGAGGSYTYGAAPGAANFTAVAIRDDDRSVHGDRRSMTAGDLVRLHVVLHDGEEAPRLAAATTFRLELAANGGVSSETITTPARLGADVAIPLL